MHRLVVAALLVMAMTGAARAGESDDTVENLVFVGRLVAIEEVDPCEGRKDCIPFDQVWQARYAIEQTLVGAHAGGEITLRIADHYGYPAVARFAHALLFVGLFESGPWLHKYQGFGMQPLAGGGWGYCGGPLRATEGEPSPPEPTPLPFAGAVRFHGEVDAGEYARLLGEGNFTVQRGGLQCRRGIALPAFYEAIRKGALQARGVRLPAWPEIGQRP